MFEFRIFVKSGLMQQNGGKVWAFFYSLPGGQKLCKITQKLLLKMLMAHTASNFTQKLLKRMVKTYFKNSCFYRPILTIKFHSYANFSG